MPWAASVLFIMLGLALIAGCAAVDAGSEPPVEATPTPFPSACAMFSSCVSIPPAVQSVLGDGVVVDVPPPAADGLAEARVTRILSGDRLVLDLDGRSKTVVLADIDAPDGCYAVEAKTRLWALVDLGGRAVLLEEAPGQDAKDREVFVWLRVDEQDVLVNALLVATGHARAAGPTDGHYGAVLEAAERVAEERGAGLWAACQGRLPGQAGDG